MSSRWTRTLRHWAGLAICIAVAACASAKDRSAKEQAREAGRAVQEAAREVGKGAKKGAKAVAEVAKDGAQAVKEGAQELQRKSKKKKK